MQPVGIPVYAASTSVTLPAHQVGDLIFVAAVRFNSTTIPSLPAGYTSLHTSSSTHGRRLGYKIAGSSSETSGTWTNATTVVAAVYRGATPGAVASSTSTIPGLTLQRPGDSWVWVYHCSSSPITPSGFTTRLDLPASDRRISDSAAPLSSWAGVTTSTNFAFALELVPTTVSSALTIQRSAAGAVSSAVQIQRSQVVASVSSAISISRRARASVESSLPIVRNVESLGTWRDLVRTPYWLQTVGAAHRTISARAELVDTLGRPVMVEVDGRPPSWDLPLAAAKVSLSGGQQEQWKASFTFTDPWMVPRDPSHPLFGMRDLRIRVWWRILTRDEVWLESLLCTVVPQDPDSRDTGPVTTTVAGRDVLSTARGGYGGTLDVGGMTLDQVIASIFDRVAPTLQLRIAATTVTAPTSCILGENDPLDDAATYAAAAWPDGVLYSDRDGIVTAGPRPAPVSPLLDWQEGPTCAVTEMGRSLKTSALGNRVTVLSTNSESVGVYATVQDDDPSSPTWVGGPWGVHPLPDVDTDLTTTEACRNLALSKLDEGLHPVEDVEVTVPQRPDLLFQHPVQLAREQLGVGGTYRVSSWDLEVPVDGLAPKPMTVRMMQRVVR